MVKEFISAYLKCCAIAVLATLTGGYSLTGGTILALLVTWSVLRARDSVTLASVILRAGNPVSISIIVVFLLIAPAAAHLALKRLESMVYTFHGWDAVGNFRLFEFASITSAFVLGVLSISQFAYNRRIRIFRNDTTVW